MNQIENDPYALFGLLIGSAVVLSFLGLCLIGVLINIRREDRE